MSAYYLVHSIFSKATVMQTDKKKKLQHGIQTLHMSSKHVSNIMVLLFRKTVNNTGTWKCFEVMISLMNQSKWAGSDVFINISR
jgi:hypothetical protein